MPKAEIGSTKYLANKMKMKGLQRLRWYCQACEKQCRDENGFKQHTMSEGHVRALQLIGEDPKKHIREYSRQFQRDFLQLLKTSHGEKKVHLNNFYQEYIKDKEHIHMNATEWPSLTEFAKHLGRDGICRVEEGDKGVEVQFIDDSAEAIKRREDVRRKEKQAKGDEDVEARMLEAQMKRAREAAERSAMAQVQKAEDGEDDVPAEPVKVSMSLGGKVTQKQQQQQTPKEEGDGKIVQITDFATTAEPSAPQTTNDTTESDTPTPQPEQQPAKMSMSLHGEKPKPTNPLMAKKKNPLSGKKYEIMAEPEKKMSNTERIMKEEIERKRIAEQRGGGFKKQRIG